MPTTVEWAMELERREQMRSGGTREAARRVVARKASMSPGTWANIVKRRLKFVDRWKANIFDLLIREPEQEILRLQHELEILRRMGVDAREDQMQQTLAHIAKARALLNDMK